MACVLLTFLRVRQPALLRFRLAGVIYAMEAQALVVSVMELVQGSKMVQGDALGTRSCVMRTRSLLLLNCHVLLVPKGHQGHVST